MSKPRLSETQIIALLKEAESGVPVPELRGGSSFQDTRISGGAAQQ